MRAIGFFLVQLTFAFHAVAGTLTISFDGQIVSDKSITVEGKKSDEAIKASFVITNTSGLAVQVKVRKTEIKLVAGTLNSFCMGECYSPSVTESVNPFTIGSNQSTGKDVFYTEYFPNGIPGISEIKYEVTDVNNRNNVVSITVNYIAKEMTILEEKSGNEIQLNIFPVPVIGEFFIVQCTSVPEFLPSKLEIHGISGVLHFSGEMAVSQKQFLVSTARLSNGWYIATLNSKGKIITQRKFILRRK
jgi:hypothetical protein